MYSDFNFYLIIILFYFSLRLINELYFQKLYSVLNIFALAGLFGVKLALVNLFLSLFLWALLRSSQCVTQIYFRKFFSLSAAVIIFFIIFYNDGIDILVRYLGYGEEIPSFFIILGVSYLGLRMWDCAASVNQGERLVNPLHLSGFLMPFFMVIAGPTCAYRDYLKGLSAQNMSASVRSIVDCLFLVSTGLFLKFFIASNYQTLFLGGTDIWVVDGVWGTWKYLMFIMFEFWGYSLVALGVGNLLGVPTPQNFNHPYLAKSFADFWGRWHMSLGDFVKRNFYNPLLLNMMRRFHPKFNWQYTIINTLALWVPFIFTGLWHHFSTGFFLWGLLVGFLVAIEKGISQVWWVKKYLSVNSWKAQAVGIVYTQLMVAATLSIVIKEF